MLNGPYRGSVGQTRSKTYMRDLERKLKRAIVRIDSDRRGKKILSDAGDVEKLLRDACEGF